MVPDYEILECARGQDEAVRRIKIHRDPTEELAKE
jgi:hypothetical protein